MENKSFPEQENQPSLPQELTAFPAQEEELPVIEDLLFTDEMPSVSSEESPAAEQIHEEPDFAEDPLQNPETAEPVDPSNADLDPAPALEELIFAPESFETELKEEAVPLSQEQGASPIVSEINSEPELTADPVSPVPSQEKSDAEAPISVLSDLESSQEILPDNHAMDSHGMLSHGQEEPPFDMSQLDNLGETPPEEPAPTEDVSDQEFRDNGQDFDAMFHAPAPKKKPDPLPRQPHKGRPKRKKGEGLLGIPNILVTFVWLALIVMIGVTLGRMLWVCAADVLAFGREDKSVTLTIYEADTMDDIIDKLHDNGLIRYKSLFKLYADISDAEEDIKPGIYDLNTRYDYHALVNFMSPRSSREVITLTIPEGYTCRQIFSLLEEHRICTAVDIAAYASDGELNDYWFLEGVERGSENCLEGYLFPDTYEFYKNSTPREALTRMLNNYEIKFSEEMRAQIDTLNATFGCNYTVREITIIASLIEKESAAPGESPKVSGVIYNRLFHWGSTPAYLNIDASIVYALDGKSDLTQEDLQMDHPYNTYTNIGLTPGPISNPGLASLQAALNPDSHNYYYYVLNPSTGMHQFSTTYDEHLGHVNRFREGQ